MTGMSSKPGRHRVRTAFWAIALTITALLAGCGGPGDPAPTVERYMEAKVNGDSATIQALLCSDLELTLERESMTFSTVTGAEIRGMSCQQVGDGAAVKCNGEIVALYGEEENIFPLTTYRVVEEDGEWKWCGESN